MSAATPPAGDMTQALTLPVIPCGVVWGRPCGGRSSVGFSGDQEQAHVVAFGETAVLRTCRVFRPGGRPGPSLDGFDTPPSKGLSGLDEHQVRRWTLEGWCVGGLQDGTDRTEGGCGESVAVDVDAGLGGATAWQNCDESRRKADKLLIKPTGEPSRHRRPADISAARQPLTGRQFSFESCRNAEIEPGSNPSRPHKNSHSFLYRPNLGTELRTDRRIHLAHQTDRPTVPRPRRAPTGATGNSRITPTSRVLRQQTGCAKRHFMTSSRDPYGPIHGVEFSDGRRTHVRLACR